MTEILIIKTENSEKVRNLLNKENINYQIFSEKDQEFPEDDKLLQEYREAYQNPELLATAKKWEKAEIKSWLNYEQNRAKK